MRELTRCIHQLTNKFPNSPTQMRRNDQVALLCSSTVPPPSFPTHPGASIHSRSKGLLINHARRWIGKKLTKRRRCLIDILPDDVLLAIFDFCMVPDPDVGEGRFRFRSPKQRIESWQTLVHVCRRWRSLVFGSPRRLKLRLACSPGTPARDMLDVWPALPLLIPYSGRGILVKDVDNIVAVLERSDRVNEIDLSMNHGEATMKKVWAAMQQPFPELTDLGLMSYRGPEPVLPDSFLGGSAPRLRNLTLIDMPFPGLPKLLLSATHLVRLDLRQIPHSGYFSPEAIATALSTSTSLRSLRLSFRSPQSHPDWASRRPPPLPRSFLPVLAELSFRGVGEYLDDLVARIDAPRLDSLSISFFNQITFDTPQVIQLIVRTPRLNPLVQAHVLFSNFGIITIIILSSQTSLFRGLKVEIPHTGGGPDRQVSSIVQICTSCLPLLSTLEDLYINGEHASWQSNIKNTQWLELLHLFTTVKNLYLSEEIAPRIVTALQELVGDRTTEVLPTLQSIFLQGRQPSWSVQEGVRQFVAARQVAGHPIAVTRWKRYLEKDD